MNTQKTSTPKPAVRVTWVWAPHPEPPHMDMEVFPDPNNVSFAFDEAVEGHNGRYPDQTRLLHLLELVMTQALAMSQPAVKQIVLNFK